MLTILRAALPVPEADLRAALQRYNDALEAHKLTEGEPAPWPEHEIIFEIMASGGNFSVAEEEILEPEFDDSLEGRNTRIDAAADRARRRYVPFASVVPEYQQAESEAAAFKAGGYQGNAPSSVASWAAAKGWTAHQAADDILGAAVLLRGKLMQIRSVRLAGKEAVRSAAKTPEQVIAELDAL